MENDLSVRYTVDDKIEALSIMIEAAQWLIDTNKPMWDVEEFTPEHYQNTDGHFVVMWRGDESVATAILSFEDKFFWPYIAANTSGFIHKLAVKRKYAGSGYSKKLIEHIVQICKSRGINALRLDCDPHREGLCAFYEQVGFMLKETKSLHTKRLGTIDLAYYELFF
jgi:GNAT superfamily N-acetyltransferase